MPPSMDSLVMQRMKVLNLINSHYLLTDWDWGFALILACITLFIITGFVDPMKVCCGYHVRYDHVWCGNKASVNGKEVYGASCGNPSSSISWDGVHYTQAANQCVANHILNGSLSNPSIPITQACHRS